MLARSFAPMFPVEMMEQDSRYVLDTTEASGARVPIAEATLRVIAEASEQRHGDENLTDVVQLYI